MQLASDTLLQSGKYRIIRVLGQGGFGITYLAEHVLLGKKVAIKEFFPKQYCDRDEATSHVTIGTSSNKELIAKLKRRFLKEARNIATLEHPNIVKIQDVFEENDTAYYVMDYIDGESLQQMVKEQGALSEQEALYYIRKVGESLEYIHSMHMTHFDVKPANVMVRLSDNEPFLIDFGLSKQYTQEGDATTTGLSGLSRGFSAIELAYPEKLSTFSEQTDVYSLGATLYYLLTGSIPPDSSALSSGLEVLEFPSYLSPTISKAISSAMEVNRTKRCPNVLSFLLRLRNLNKTCNSKGIINNDTQRNEEETKIIAVKVEKQEKITKNIKSSKIDKNLLYTWIFFGFLLMWLLIIPLIGINGCSRDSGNFFNSDYDLCEDGDTLLYEEEDTLAYDPAFH